MSSEWSKVRVKVVGWLCGNKRNGKSEEKTKDFPRILKIGIRTSLKLAASQPHLWLFLSYILPSFFLYTAEAVACCLLAYFIRLASTNSAYL